MRGNNLAQDMKNERHVRLVTTQQKNSCYSKLEAIAIALAITLDDQMPDEDNQNQNAKIKIAGQRHRRTECEIHRCCMQQLAASVGQQHSPYLPIFGWVVHALSTF